MSHRAINLAEIIPKKNGNDEFVGPSAITKEEVAAKIRSFSSSATESSINAVADAVMRQKGNERKLLAQLEKLDALASHKPYYTYGDEPKNTCDVLLAPEVADLFVRHT